MKKNYQLIALDMDGTLLNSEKEISPRTQDAIRRAIAAGKQVVMCTGRAVAELREYFALFPEMRYAVTASGASVYDAWEKCFLTMHPLDWALVEEIFALGEGKDLQPQIFMGDAPHFTESTLEHCGHYHTAHFEVLFRRNGILCEDAYQRCREERGDIIKINYYHTDTDDRQDSHEWLAHLPLVFADSEETGLEMSPEGIDKGTGLEELCALLGIPMEDTIAVGDSFNDLPVLRRAGLSVAVGNAKDAVKEICDMVVADCDHDGVAEAIEEYLM